MAYSRSIKHASKIGRYAWNIAMASRRALIASALRGLPVRGSMWVAEWAKAQISDLKGQGQ